MRSALTIAAKELRQRSRDRSIFIVGLVVPLALAGILSLSLSGITDDEFTTSYAVADEDGGPLGRGLADVVDSLGFAEVTRVSSAQDAERLVADGEVRAAFIVPAGFSESVQAGEGGRIRVVADPKASVSAQIADSVARSYAAELNAVQLSVATVLAAGGGADPASVQQIIEQAQAAPPLAVLDTAVAADRQTGPQTFFAMGMAVFFLFFTVEFGVRSLMEERQMGTMSRLLAAPLRPGAVIAGKTLAAFVAGVVSMTVLIVASDVLLGAVWGNPAGVAILVVGGVLAAMGITALVSTLARTPEQAGAYASLIAVTMGLLGGAFFPLGDGVLGAISLATPHAWLLRGFRNLAAGGPVAEVLTPLGVVLAFAVVCGSIAVIRAGRLVERA